jgi:biopolymer transport protein ExbD
MIRSNSKEDSFLSKANITPIVDVSLVLVITFMIMAPIIMQAGIRILEQRKKIAPKGKHKFSESVRVNLTSDNKILINGKEILWNNLSMELKRYLEKSKNKYVILTADNKNKVYQVVEILDVAKQNGAKKLSIYNKQKEEILLKEHNANLNQ